MAVTPSTSKKRKISKKENAVVAVPKTEARALRKKSPRQEPVPANDPMEAKKPVAAQKQVASKKHNLKQAVSLP